MAKGRKTGGRKAGTPNKCTDEVKQLAQQYTAEAIDRLAAWMRSDNPKASVAASSALLDRGHGKPGQTIESTVNATVGYAAQPIPVEQRHSDSLEGPARTAVNGHSA